MSRHWGVVLVVAFAPACHEPKPAHDDAVDCATRKTFERDLKQWANAMDFPRPMGATLVPGVGVGPACLGEPTWVARNCVEDGGQDVLCTRDTGWELQYEDGALDRVRTCLGDRVRVATSHGISFGQDQVGAQNDEGVPQRVVHGLHGSVIWQYPGLEIEFARSFDRDTLRVRCLVAKRVPAR